MPNQHVVLEMRAIVLHSLKRYEEALADNQRAYALNPGNADTCNNIGASLQFLSRDEEALPWFDRAIALRPGHVLAHAQQGRLAAADASACRGGSDLSPCQAHRPRQCRARLEHVAALHADRQFRGRLGHARGPLEESQPGRLSQILGAPMVRRERTSKARPSSSAPTKDWATPFNSRATSRWWQPLGARVILVVDPPAHALLSGMPGVSQCLRKDIGVSAAVRPALPDVRPAAGIRHALDTIPPGAAYLPPLPAGSPARLGRPPRPPRQIAGRPGLVRQSRAQQRSQPIDLAANVRPHVRSRCDLCQSAEGSAARRSGATLLEHPEIIDPTADLTDFVETAALICPASMWWSRSTPAWRILPPRSGRPTWILLPYDPDYRWLLDRDDSPWYPTARLFRQNEKRDYAVVLDRVRDELESADRRQTPA